MHSFAPNFAGGPCRLRCIELISNETLVQSYYFRGPFQLICLRELGRDLPRELCRAYRVARLDFAIGTSLGYAGFQQEACTLTPRDLAAIVDFVHQNLNSTDRLVISCESQVLEATALAEILGEFFDIPVNYGVPWKGTDKQVFQHTRLLLQQKTSVTSFYTNSVHDDLLDLVYLIFRSCAVSGILSPRVMTCSDSGRLSEIEMEMAFALSFTPDRNKFRPAHPVLGQQRPGISLAEFLKMNGMRICNREGCTTCVHQSKMYRDPIWFCIEFDAARLPTSLSSILDSRAGVILVTSPRNIRKAIDTISTSAHISVAEHINGRISVLFAHVRDSSSINNLDLEFEKRSEMWVCRRYMYNRQHPA